MASLSEENITSLYRCETKNERRRVLANILNITSCDDDEDDIKSSIMLDYYLESIHFASEHGFSWQQGLAVFELMKELLNCTLDLPLLQATEHFKTILKSHATTIESRKMTSVIDFAFLFFFNHFNLYKFVFTSERDMDRRTTHLSIETPPQDLPPLGQATERSEWERQQVLKNLEDEHNKKLMEKQLQLDSEVERLKSLVHDQLSLLNTDQPITTADLNDIVEETVKMYVTSAASTIHHLIEESHENLLYEFEKSAVEQKLESRGKTPRGTPRGGLNKKKGKVSRASKR